MVHFSKDMAGTALEAVGDTPLVRIQRLHDDAAPNVKIFAKAEWFNPAESVKDRAAFFMLRDALETGKLTPEKEILDATSGNTGIAIAMMGAALQIPVTLCLPENASPERKKILKAYDAKLVLTDPLESTDGAIHKAKELYQKNPERYFYVDQYNNPMNWKAHLETTGPEIWKQTDGQITHFVTGLGTTGTLMGVGRYLKSKKPDVQIIAMQPDSAFHGLEGLKHLESAMVPGIYDPSVPDRQITVSTEDAQKWTRRLAREEGLFVGISSGANFAAALAVARELDTGLVVTIFCDSGDKYMSEAFWKDEG